ncbi:MAG: RNA polymerase sigma factor (sigma-70 family) [Crocinitomicaceae bacterium]|jgi:RNA polymerase sigma factor (sigma-70 family)
MRNAFDIHQDLIEGSKNGDRKAQKALFDLYSKAMFNIGVRLLGNTEDAADVAQDTFIDAFTKLDQFKGTSSFGAWMKRIMINKSINFLNRKKIHFELVVDVASTEEDELEDQDFLMQQLMASLPDLPEGCRVIFTLFYFEGFDHDEIASILKISKSTSKSQLSRARGILRSLILQIAEA